MLATIPSHHPSSRLHFSFTNFFFNIWFESRFRQGPARTFDYILRLFSRRFETSVLQQIPQACCAAQGNWNFPFIFPLPPPCHHHLYYFQQKSVTQSVSRWVRKRSPGESGALVLCVSDLKDPFTPNDKRHRHLVWRTECKRLRACLPCSVTKRSRCVCLLTDNRLSAVWEVRGLVGLWRPVVRDVGRAGEFRRISC